MSASKSKVSVKSKASKNSKITTTKNDIYDEWRPPPGIKYQLSQTNVDFNAIVPRMKLKYTTVEYEPGQDLTIKESRVKYARPRGRGPVLRFQEEILAEKAKIYNEKMLKLVLARVKRVKKQWNSARKAMHDSLMYQIGPPWFHEMSLLQMQSADSLKAAMEKDKRFKTIINTQETLCKLGLVLWPNHTKIEYALKKYHECPVEFLMTLFRLNRPKEEEKQNDYTLNDRILLSAVVHLSIRDIFRELHLRIPSPPNVKNPKPFRIKRKRKKKYPKWYRSMSPYLESIIPLEQKRRQGVYKNRHKEYPSLEYFDYVDDMWDIKIVDDPDSVIKRKVSKTTKKNKWTRPPKIPVRFVESKMKKKKIYQLKKPSPYTSPCKIILKKVEPEIVIDSDIDVDNICKCSPKNFTEDTAFDLKIKITTSDDEVYLTQKLCPYKKKDTLGNLNFVDQKRIEKCLNDDDTEGKPIKRIEYRCECCICGKSVNISGSNTTDIEKNLNKGLMEGLETIPEYGEEDEGAEEELPEVEPKICPCRTPSTPSSEDSDDTYALCTCHSSSDSCTCCICEKMDKDFLQHIKHFNEVYGTDHIPCTCDCKCKKKKPKSLCEGPPPYKYCFCTKPEEEAEEEEEGEEENVTKKDTNDPKSKDNPKEKPKEQEKKKEEPPKTPETPKVPPKTNIIKEIKISTKKDSTSGENTGSDKISIDEENCECMKLYTQYLDAHESCLSLFTQYQKKIENDIQEYMKELNKDRCTCGDSIPSEHEGEGDENYDEEVEEIQKIICDCTCCNDDPFAGCTCNDFPGCSCCNGSTSTSSSDSSGSSESSDSDSQCMCCCTCGPCQCTKFFEKVKTNIEAKSRAPSLKNIENLQHTSLTTVKGKVKSLDGTGDESLEGEEEDDPRIYKLDEFPTNRNDQMDLLRKVLEDLENDGYPMASLPQVHRLPHFQVWLDKRSGKYVSMEDRDTLMAISKLWWSHIDICARECALPEDVPKEEKHEMTWGRVKAHQRLLVKLRTDFWRRLKQANIDQAQEFFPTMFHYKLPNKTFRNMYFAYFPADENHCQDFRVWKVHEMKNMKTRKSCL